MMPLQTFVTADAILHLPSAPEQKASLARRSPKVPPVLFYITGNPGLIGYYKEYLDLLATSTPTHSDTSESNSTDQSAAKAASSDQCVIAGFSLGGFGIGPLERHEQNLTVDEDATPQKRHTGQDDIDQLVYPPSFARKDIYTLQDQIALCYARLTYLVERVHKHYCGDVGNATVIGRQANDNGKLGSISKHPGPNSVRVIVAGHSVGAYIALELVRMHYEKYNPTTKSVARTASPLLSPSPEEATRPISFDIISALLLTPTIIDLALSPSGTVATPLLTIIPSVVPFLLQCFSRGLAILLSRKNLEYVVHKFTGMKLDSAGLKTTAAFLSTRAGVKQALSMAGDELREMRENKWGDEVWGRAWSRVGSPPSNKSNENENESQQDVGTRGEDNVSEWTSPRLFFIFAQNDHWIADTTRDAFLKEIRDRTHTNSSKRINTSTDTPTKPGNTEPVGTPQVDNVNSSPSSDRGTVFEPTVVIDEEQGLVHGWCLEQSEFMAQITKQWIRQILRDH